MMHMDETYTDDDTRLGRSILKLIRIRQTNQFEKDLQKKFCKECFFSSDINTRKSSHCDSFNDLEMISELERKENESGNIFNFEENNKNEDDYESSDSEHEFKEKLMTRNNYSWRVLYNKINEQLEDLRNAELNEYLDHYTSILKLHIDHRVVLDLQCYNSLFYCVKPKHIENLFNMGLIDSTDSIHIGCLLERNHLFMALLPENRPPNSSETDKIIISLSILLYKIKCKTHLTKIIDSLNSRLAVFINREEYEENSFKIGIKHFIKSLILNGILNNPNLNEFLKNTDHRLIRSSGYDSDSDSSEMWPSSDETIDEDEDDSEGPQFQARINRRDHNNNNIQANHVHVQHHNHQHIRNKSVGERLNLNTNVNEYSKMFPLSLKNLSRIAIKNYMEYYSLKNVKKLYILPNVFKNFLMFQEEIDSALRSISH